MSPRDKRISTMQRRLEQFRALPRGEAQSLPGALPPGQSWVPKGFPVLDLGEHPEISHDDWRLSVDGQVQVPIELDLAGLLELSSVSLEVDIHCVTAWSVPSAQWLGVPTEALKPLLDLEEDVTHVMVYGSDGYAANLCLKDFFAENSLLAYGLNGGELSISHGGPVRLVVPHLYFWKSPKWINRLEFMKSDRPGFWEQRGYHNRGNPWSEERSAPITQPKVVENPATESAQNTRITEGHAKRLSWWGRIKDWF